MKTIIVFLSVFLTNILIAQNSDWTHVNPRPQNDFYAIKFFSQNTGYVIGSGGIILKNTTGSNNWVTIPSGTVNDLYSMYFFDVNNGYIVGSGGLIMYTSDSGNNWTHLVTSNGYNLRSITFVNQNTGFIVGDHGELYKTTAGIYGWVPVSVTNLNLRSVYFVNANTGFAGGDSGIVLKTTNSGVNWTSQSIINSSVSCISFTNQLTGFISTSTISNYSNCLKTTDGGNTWNPMSFFNIAGYWYTLGFINPDTGFIAGSNNLLMKTSFAGSSWTQTYIPVQTNVLCSSCVDTTVFFCGTNGWIYETSLNGYFKNLGGTRNSFTSIAFDSENTGCMIGGYLTLRTTSGGSIWDIKTYGSTMWGDPGSDSHISALSVLRSGNLCRKVTSYSSGWQWEGIDESNDGGLTWSSKFAPGGGPPAYVTIYGFDEINNVMYASYENMGSAFIQKNTGSGWTNVYVYNFNNFSPGRLSFANQNTGVVLGSSSVPKFLRTTNGGSSWDTVLTGYSKGVGSLQLLSDGTGFIGGDSAFLMRTYDYGANWTVLPNNGSYYVTNLNFVSDNVGWYISQTSSYPPVKRLFFTRNGGTNFQQLQSLMNFNVNSFSFIDQNTGYVCGDSGVVLKTTNGGLTFVHPTTTTLPKEYSLSQNFPNPFNPVTKIKFDIPIAGNGGDRLVKINIYDVLGREVTTLLNQQMQPGSYSVDWDASNYPSGVYFYKLEAGDYVQSKKMVLIK